MLFNRFHDANFDGVKLLIPTGFILTNPELEESLENLLRDLKNCKFSTMTPDHSMNIFELENYKSKKDKLKEEEQSRIKEEESRRQRIQDKLDKKFIEVFETKEKSPVDLDQVWIGGVYVKDLFNKKSLKTSAKKKIDKYIHECNLEQFKEFMLHNSFYLGDTINLPEFNIKRCYISMDSYFNICLNYYQSRVRIYSRGKRNKEDIFYRSPSIRYDPKKKYYFISGSVQEGLVERKDKRGEHEILSRTI